MINSKKNYYIIKKQYNNQIIQKLIIWEKNIYNKTQKIKNSIKNNDLFDDMKKNNQFDGWTNVNSGLSQKVLVFTS